MRAGLPRMRLMTEPTQHFRSAVFEVWHDKVAGNFCNRQGFRLGRFFDLFGSHQLLVSSELRERETTHCLETFSLGEFGTAMCSAKQI